MLRSGEQIRRRGPKVASSEVKTRSGVWVPRARRKLARGGVKPSSEAEIRPRVRQALKRGRDSVVRRLALERDVGSPEGCHGWLFDGPLRLFGPWTSLCPGS
jgi:hypothetical protein